MLVIMTSQNADVMLWQELKTKETNGLFFEVVQRVGNYQKYGETNAFIRLAAQADRY